ncbi:MAG: hypothetical protein WD969_07140 [Paracoccaceae bacterium]
MLVYLRAHLREGAVLVPTTHGTLVENRIRTGERLYNLDEAGARDLLETYDANGYGFGAYPKMNDYGISLVTQEKMTALIEAAGLSVVHFEQQGWVKHQDVFGVTRSS